MKSVLVLGVFVVFTESMRYDLRDRLQNYNKNMPPSEPIDIQVGFYFWRLKMNDNNELEVGLYLRHLWYDERLAGLDDEVSLYGDTFKDIWRPDLFIRDATFKVKDDGVDVYQLTKVNATGRVWQTISMDGTMPCRKWYLENDLVRNDKNHTKLCSLKIQSFGFTTNELTLSWLPSAMEFEWNILDPTHYMTNYFLENCAGTYPTGSHPCLEVSLEIEPEVSSSMGTQMLASFLLTLIVYFIVYATTI